MGSDESHFNVSFNCEGQSHKTVSTNHNLFWRESRAQAKSAYQPNALPLGQAGLRGSNLWVTITFYRALWILTEAVAFLQRYLVVIWFVPTGNFRRFAARSVCKILYTSLQCRFMQSHILRGHAYLAVTCHLHFWQNDWDLLSASAVTQIAK